MLLIPIVISLLVLAAAAMLAAAETAVLLLPVGRVHRLAESRAKGAEELDALAEQRHRLRAVSTLVGGLAFALTGYTGMMAAGTGLSALANFPIVDFVWFVVLIWMIGGVLGVALAHSLGQALPRSVAVANPERLGLEAAPLALRFVRVLWPLARLLGAPWRWGVEVIAKEPTLTPWAVTPEFWGGGVGEETDREREEAEEALLEAVAHFAEKVAREVMVPRTDVASLPAGATAEEAIDAIERTGFSRLPIYRESIDDVVGVLYAKDLLVALGRGTKEPSIARIARKPFFVPETKPVEELLLEMRVKTHIAIVADEYGGTSGIVTLEDLLEEIVGEISDEYDRDVPLLEDLGDDHYRVDARLPVNDLNDLLGTDLDTEADSVGGLFTEVAGRIPELGESLVIEGLRFTVTERQGTRVMQLTVEPAVERPEGDSDA